MVNTNRYEKFLKNGIIHLIFSSVYLHDEDIFVECLQIILFQSTSIFNKSSSSELQDIFPIEIFNYQVLAAIL